MQRQALEVAEEAMSKFQVEKDIAQYIKKEVRCPTGCVFPRECAVAVFESEHPGLIRRILVRLPRRGYMALHRWKEFWELRHTRYDPADIM